MKSNYVVAPGPVGSGNINFQIEIVRTQCVVCSMGLCVGGEVVWGQNYSAFTANSLLSLLYKNYTL